MLSNYGAGKDSWESLGQQGDQSINPKRDQPCVPIGRTDSEAEAPILWPPDVNSWLVGKDWCLERQRTKGEEGDRGWDGWMASLNQWTWVWADSRSWWRTGKPGVLQSMKSQRVRHNLVTEKQQQQNKTAPSSLPHAISSVWKVIPDFTSCLSFHTSDWR